MKITDASITAVIDLYHQLLPMCPPVRRVTQELADQIKRRIAEHDLPNLDIWRVYFTHISQCDLLTGRTPPRNGHRQPFVATLQWLTRDDNYRDIEYGKYFPTSKSSAAKQQEQPYVRH